MIIYTTITNAYDTIPDHYYDPDVKYVLFYDEDIEQKGPWESIRIPKGGDPVLKSYRIRTLSHLHFNEPHVWVDACYRMSEEFVKLSKDILNSHPIALQKHPEPRLLAGEFCNLHEKGYVPEDRLIKCAEDIVATGYKASMFDHTINCAIWRQVTPQVIDFNVEYWRWYEQYGLYHGCQITSAIAEYLTFGENVFRVDSLLELSDKSNRIKEYPLSYEMRENSSTKKFAQIITEILQDIPMIAFTEECPGVPLSDDSVDDMIVYSCITNGYDEIPDQYYDPSVRYVMFHDGTIDIPEPWESIDIRDYCSETNPRLLSFYPKAMPHLFFPQGSNTVWVDGCYVMTKEFIEKSRRLFPHTIVKHPDPSVTNFIDEMMEGYVNNYYSDDDGLNLVRELDESGYKFARFKPVQGIFVWRTIIPEMIEFNELWWKWGIAGNPRDNIAHDAALQFTGLHPEVVNNRGLLGMKVGKEHKVGRKKQHPTIDTENYNAFNFRRQLSKITKVSVKLK